MYPKTPSKDITAISPTVMMAWLFAVRTYFYHFVQKSIGDDGWRDSLLFQGLSLQCQQAIDSVGVDTHHLGRIPFLAT